jgi:hypothetical protein
MADAGIPVQVLRKIAGHGSLTTTQRSLHPSTANDHSGRGLARDVPARVGARNYAYTDLPAASPLAGDLHDPAVALRMIYLMFSNLLRWMALRIRSDTTKEVEILVLRHQLAVLRGSVPASLKLGSSGPCWSDAAGSSPGRTAGLAGVASSFLATPVGEHHQRGT